MPRFSCPNCLTSYPLKRIELVGKRVRCRKCERAFTVALAEALPAKELIDNNSISHKVVLQSDAEEGLQSGGLRVCPLCNKMYSHGLTPMCPNCSDVLLSSAGNPIAAISLDELAKHNQGVRESRKKLFLGACVVVFLYLFFAMFKPSAKLSQTVQYDSLPVRSQPDLERRMDHIDERIRQTSPLDSRQIDGLRSDVDQLVSDVRRDTSERINRKNGQAGYSLEVRKEAAIRTLMRQGHSLSEARELVDDMVRLNILPDPPRQ